MDFIALRSPFLGASKLFLKKNAAERPDFARAQFYSRLISPQSSICPGVRKKTDLPTDIRSQSNFEFRISSESTARTNRPLNFDSRSRSNFSCASSVGLSQNVRLGRTKGPWITKWLEKTAHCLYEFIWKWAADSENARAKMIFF